MGCDIHMYGEALEPPSKYKYLGRIAIDRNYALFAWLAGVRNYAGLIPFADPRNIPDDASAEILEMSNDWELDAHTRSWYSVAELLAVNFEEIVENRRCFLGNSGAHTCERGAGQMITLGDLIGRDFIEEMKRIGRLGCVRVIFWFDN